MGKLFCFGYGYTCDYLWRHLKSVGGWSVAGTTRERAKQKAMRSMGIESHLFDTNMPLTDPAFILKDVTHILISVPPDDQGDPSFRLHAEDILELGSVEWIGYFSSGAVYGNRLGGMVNEESEIRPDSIRGSRRAKAEAQWLSLFKSHEIPIHIFRLAGIYGPGRSALDSVRAGVARRIDKPGHAFNRVYVEDIVQTVAASIAKPSPGSIYNVSDDFPAPSHEVIAYACDLLGIETPPLIPYAEADLAPITKSFYSDNKRIDNSKIKTELDVVLKCPDYISGLRACLAAEEQAMEEIKHLY